MRGMRTPDPDLFFMSVVEAVVGIVSGGIGSEVKIHFKTFNFLPSNEISCLLLYDTYFQLFLKAVIVFSSIFSNLFFFLSFSFESEANSSNTKHNVGFWLLFF